MRNSKLLKKFTSAAAALALVAGLLSGVGSIEAQAAGAGKITVHKYARSTSGEITDNTYTGDEITDTSSLGTPLEGAEFTLYKLNTSALDTALANGNKYVSHTIAANNTNVTFTLDGAGTPSVITVVANVTTTEVDVTDTDGKIEFSDLEDAYYLLVETFTPDGYDTAEKSVIRMPLTKGDGTEHNRDIHVYPKNVKNTSPISKAIDGAYKVLNEGENVKFNITTDFRNLKTDEDQVSSVNDLKDGTAYGDVTVIDVIQEYFEYVSVNEVYLVDAAGNRISTLGTSDYTVDESALSAARNGALTISLTDAGIEKAIAEGASSFVINITTKYLGGYGMVGTETPVVKNVAMSIINKANAVDPTDPPVDPTDPDEPIDPDIPVTEVYLPTTSIVVNKVTKTGALLDGVTFHIAKVANPTSDSDYVLAADGSRLELTTDTRGLLTYNGLDYNELTGTTYYLQEISTKAGYQIKTELIAVTLQAKTHGSNSALVKDGEWIEGAVVKTEVTVVNYKNEEIDPDEPTFSLPLTGGQGTIIFTIVGILLMLGAAVIYIRSRKRA